MKRREVLDTAATCVCKDRNEEYGPPQQSFARIAAHWMPILGIEITPAQVALCMAAVKIARLSVNPGHSDGWIDLAGYAACGGEIATEVKETDAP